MKIIWVFSHPAPYKINFFNELGKRSDLHVIFERESEGDRPKAFYYQKAKNFKMEILSSVKLGDHNNYCGAIVKKLKKESYDLLVINGYITLTEMKLIRYLKKKGKPYVIAINGGIIRKQESALRKKIKTKYMSGASLYLCPDESSKEYLIYYGADPEKIRLYPYSTIFENEILPAPLTQDEKIALRKEKGLPTSPLFISVSAFSKRKNVLGLLELWQKAPKDHSLLLVGSGELQKECEDFVKHHNLDNVKLVPFVSHEEALTYFKMADASILWTKEDIYGHVVNESLSQGTPVIASINSNAAKRLIEDGKTGYLLDLSDEEGFHKAINSDFSDEMRNNCLAKAKENTLEKMTEYHYELFKDLKL